MMKSALPDAWLIWSNEHNAYWGPNHCGYTRDIDQAGRYQQSDADSVCAAANAHLPPKSLPHEIRVPSPELDQALRALFDQGVSSDVGALAATVVVDDEGNTAVELLPTQNWRTGSHKLYRQPLPAYWSCTVAGETMTTTDYSTAADWAQDFEVEAHWSPNGME